MGIGWSSSTSLLPVSDDVGFLTMGAQRTSRVHRGFDKGKRKHSNAFKLININTIFACSTFSFIIFIKYVSELIIIIN